VPQIGEGTADILARFDKNVRAMQEHGGIASAAANKSAVHIEH
jgi:hypothetical protein